MPDRITPYGLIMFVLALWLEASVLMRPALVAKVAGADLWLAWALGLVPVAMVSMLVVWLASRFPDDSFVEYARRIWGKWLGTALILVMLTYWLGKTADAALVLGKVVSLNLLPRTPLPVLVGIELSVAAYIAWQGVGAAVRLAEFVVIPSLVVLLGTMALALPEAHLSYLQPVLHKGWRPVLMASVPLVGHAQGMDALLVIFPWLSRKEVAWKSTLLIVTGRAAAYLVMLVVPVLVLGVSDTIREILPVVAVARSLELRGLGLERVDSFFTGVWLLAGYLPVAFRLYLTSSVLARLFGQTDHRPFIWPVLALCGLGTALPQNILEYESYHQILGWFGLGALLGVIPLLALGALLRGGGRVSLRRRT